MSALSHKIDFAIIFSVKNANPNGDPLNGNRPRTDYEGFGEITDVCLKRKLRDRLQTEGHSIFVQSDEKKTDGMTSLQNRAYAESPIGLGKKAFNPKENSKDKAAELACKQWFDVRAFGQVFAFGKEGDAAGVSIAIRGPVTIQSAFSIEPVSITSTQITKSVNSEGDGTKKGSDTMGMKHRVDHAIYVAYGAMTPQLADKTGFSDTDAEAIKAILPKLFEGDASSARPEGSMAISKVIWWQHNSKAGQYSSAKVHATLKVMPDGDYDLTQLDSLKPEEISGF
ncbi:MAG: type I-C CRISPR-associated protein Cas7/Csd2 [Nitrosomonas sp.]|uniref:type I-C CRISPR-associated protein Cas7/Csd2 n=1 Tax=Nitrosomonas sp. TaxID=42353 RepID=UPI002735A208|nr:type I-C CRISPR-associated protein Cas7/Csd2 [Nitrosomonas sp.]MDP3663729.1 type I-C CRISPR-associated protein Cas7/Csd2 [Nitrosomonas sp.]MDZ4107020.1 type I-C CRISPR-associated protein Cas7/Csd2 [Nitrosomonas sp.]